MTRERPVRRAWSSGFALLAFVFVLGIPASLHAGSSAIERFAVALDVGPDASLAVQETLTFNFRGQHNGVIRLIPVRYLRHGLEFALRIDDVHVLGDGHQPLRTEVSYPGRYVRIKAWVPGAVNTTKTVRILYRVRRGLLALDDHDELYWNVTGDEWDVPIVAAEATVTLPGGLAGDDVRTGAYTGPWGAAGTAYRELRGDGAITFQTTRPLRPREGLTIVVAWPRGAVVRPTPWRQAWWLAVDHWPLALPLLALGAMGLVWRAYGRDPESNRSVKPEYEAPAGLTPAEAGTLIDQKAEPSDVIATLVDLSVRGYMAIEPLADGDYVFRRVKSLDRDPTITSLERFVLQKVFGEQLSLSERQLSELRRDSEYVFAPIRDAIYRAMVERRLFPRSPFWVRHGWGAMGVVVLFAGGVLLTQVDRFGSMGWPWAVGVGLTGLVILGFAQLMPRRTWRGVRLLVHLRGFQEFLERAEKDRLERLPPDTFHQYLPWAIALGVTEQWIHRFQAVKVDAPTWYRSVEPFRLSTFRRDLDVFGRRNTEALGAARRAAGAAGGWSGGRSGFSGGSSGGGFGGGGGRTF